jgi:hypothetical protein|tara:strand:+ start:103 stop:276 length:174 start_codon:yes stop_codon:yes gene_type:complete
VSFILKPLAATFEYAFSTFGTNHVAVNRSKIIKSVRAVADDVAFAILYLEDKLKIDG